MNRLSVGEIRKDISACLNRVAFGGARIVVQRRGKDVAALVPLEDLVLLEKLEERLDVEAALEAEASAAGKGHQPVPWDEIKAELGL